MPVTPTYPGVYVQEVPSGVRTIVGVGTSTGLFIGRAKSGPMFKPVLCLSYTDFVRAFSDDTSSGQLPYYVKLFFINGGTTCYVMRIANGPAASSVTLANEGGANVLELRAKNPGLIGENIRAIVSYGGAQPEATFNVDLFRWEVEGGRRVKKDAESWKNLSMDVSSPAYAPDFLTQNSKLVDAAKVGIVPVVPGFSQSGRVVTHANTGGGFRDAWVALIGAAVLAPQNFLISVDGSPYVKVDLSQIALAGMTPVSDIRTVLLPAAVKNAIEDAFDDSGIAGITVNVTFPVGPAPATGVSSVMRIASGGTGDVFIRPAGTGDRAVPLMLGTEQGGLEVGANSNRRPAPNGISFRSNAFAALQAINFFGSVEQEDITTVTLERILAGGGTAPTNVVVDLNTSANATDPMFVDGATNSPNGNSNGIREKFSIIAAAINAENAADPTFPWTAEVSGYRLNIRPTDAADDNFLSAAFATGPTNVATRFTNNVRAYTLGAGGLGVGAQTAGTTGSDGTAPLATDYDAAYLVADKEIDLFNLLVLAPDAAVPVPKLYPLASVFCQQRRAFLLMDAPESWTTLQQATDATTGVGSLRVGLVKDYAALFYPRVTIDDRGRRFNVGPSGAVAGLMARIDGTRGVWKAPAGTEADLRGIVGVEHRFSDGENGVLNPRAINTIRVFPNGIVNWGARTMDGDDNFASEYKYIPVRRLALFMEESLYRGLKWVVFEPNDEPLWAQIRLNVGGFMHDLFRKGAFQGLTPREAYFVKCDAETTTQTDRNLGIVNIWVGFAPLKPAEFVILYLQQMAGQIEV